MEIQILVLEDGKVIFQESSNSFMEAEDALSHLENMHEQWVLGEARNRE